MIKLSLSQLVDITKGNILNETNENQLIHSIGIDSRKMDVDSLFIALKGDHFDGHDYVEQATSQGAIALMVERAVESTLPQIIVDDCRHAMGKIAHFLRKQSSAKFVALTGSSGKTSVKEMTASILNLCGSTLYTQGNLNNDIGVPLTLFRLTKAHQFAVIELGANHIGEIAYTTHLVEPNVALVNNIAEAHIEGFGSFKGVAKAKGEIFEGLNRQGTAIVNRDSYSPHWLKQYSSQHQYFFSLSNKDTDFYASDIKLADNTQFILNTPKGQIEIILPLIGQHNIANAVAATSLAMSVGADLTQIKKGLESTSPVKGRLYPIRLNQNQLIIDDSYNANVGSMKAAIDVLAYQKGIKVLIVGDMAELGDESEKFHTQVGLYAKDNHLHHVISVGTLSQFLSDASGIGTHVETKENALPYILSLLDDKSEMTLLVKGSRSAKMDQLIEYIINTKNKR